MSIIIIHFNPFESEAKPLKRKSQKQKKFQKIKNNCDMCSPYGSSPGWVYACEDSWIRCPACTPPELY